MSYIPTNAFRDNSEKKIQYKNFTDTIKTQKLFRAASADILGMYKRQILHEWLRVGNVNAVTKVTGLVHRTVGYLKTLYQLCARTECDRKKNVRKAKVTNCCAIFKNTIMEGMNTITRQLMTMYQPYRVK
jgi:hypothetical protein